MSRDKEWFELPRPAAAARLVEIRDELQGEEPSRHRGPAAAAGPGRDPG